MNPSRQVSQGSWFSIVLLVLPIASIGWAIVDKVQFPFDQLRYLKAVAAVGSLSFLVMWCLSFWKIRNDRTLIPITLFLYLLWMFGTAFGLAKANRDFDQSTARTELRKVVSTRTVGSAGGRNSSKSYCIATLAEPLEGKDDAQIKYEECESIRIGQDGLEFQFRDGALGFSWKSEHSVVKDIDLYRERLGR